ncbi:hypothetical protein M0534_10815 [Methylonatrum kenyense]|uniref:hypothetical protein n=1 Tax=Methylonatrum kenyense TaxID=455253 RepID=UPI0020C0FB13|nr:hypothetical protein [Methylonatrum kenyense]MCK8516808.1 hypothetical protein [Methylonatrum kenyense]
MADTPCTTPVDGHVHFYAIERAAPTLNAALANFLALGRPDTQYVGTLILTQSSRENVFETMAARSSCGGWMLSRSRSEPHSLIAERGGRAIAVICGRQIRCDNGLEVAALGTTDAFPDGQPLGETLARVRDSAALAVIPWGFGKWSGKRGKAVEQVLQCHTPDSLAVGDNGGRLRLAGEPSLIRKARDIGYKVLPGSDPFPCGDDFRRVGAFGFLIGLVPSTASPWRDISRWLKAQKKSPDGYGQAVNPARFLANQIGIRLHNRRRGNITP